MSYALHILMMISIYAVLGMSLNLLLGFGGVLSLCHASFYALGAYVFALLAVDAGFSFLPAAAISSVATGIMALLAGSFILRLRGDFLVLATLSLQIITFSLLYNSTSLTHGPYGVSGIPAPSIFGFSFASPVRMVALALCHAGAVWWCLSRIVQSPYGRMLRAVRDDTLAVQSLGKPPNQYLLTAFTLSAAFAASAGVMFACYATYIDPTSFTLDESVFILCVVIIGGAGTLQGSILGSVLLVVLPEALRFIGLPDATAAALRQILYGVLLILMMRFRPQGLVGTYTFE